MPAAKRRGCAKRADPAEPAQGATDTAAMADEADDSSTRSVSPASSEPGGVFYYDTQEDLEMLLQFLSKERGSNLRSDSAAPAQQSPQRIVFVSKRDQLEQAFKLFERGSAAAACDACKFIIDVIEDPQFRLAEVHIAYDAVQSALSKHSADVHLCASGALALAKTCSRLHRGIAQANNKVLSALREHHLSLEMRIGAFSFFDFLIRKSSFRKSEIFDKNGSDAFVLALRASEPANSHLQISFCNILAGGLLDHALDESLLEAGLIEALVDILKSSPESERDKLFTACFTALAVCLKHRASIVDVLLQSDIFGIMVACLPETATPNLDVAGLVHRAWRLFALITDHRDATPGQRERILRMTVPWLSVNPVGFKLEFFSTGASVLACCCTNSNELRNLAGSLNAVSSLLNVLRNCRDRGELLCELLEALTELFHCKENRDPKRDANHVLQVVFSVLAQEGSRSMLLYARGMTIVSLLSHEDWYKRLLDLMRRNKPLRTVCVKALANVMQWGRGIVDYLEYVELVYDILLHMFDDRGLENADSESEDDDEWQRARVRVLSVFHTKIRSHLTEHSGQLSLQELQLFARVCPDKPNVRFPVDGPPLVGALELVIHSLLAHSATDIRGAGCSALNALLVIVPDASRDEVGALLRDRNVAEFLSSAICEPSKDKVLLAVSALALSSTVKALMSAHCDEDPRPAICVNILPAALQLLRTADLHGVATLLLGHLCQYSLEYRSQLATNAVIRALVTPLLSNSPVKHADEMYRVLRLLIETDEACVMHALDADLLKVKGGKSTCNDRLEVENVLRRRRDADNVEASASSDAVFAELMAEEEAAAAAKRAAQQARSSKAKKKAPPAAPAAPAAHDSPPPEEFPPDAEPAAEEAAAPSADAAVPEAAAGGSEADASQNLRRRASRRRGGSCSKKQLGKAGDKDSGEAQQLDAAGACADADALSAAGSDSQLEGFVPVETRKKGSRKQPAAEAAAPPSPAPVPPTQPQPRQRQQRELPKPQPAAPPQPSPVPPPQPPPPVAPIMHPLPLPSLSLLPSLPMPMLPPQAFAQPPPAHSGLVPLMPWQVPQPARPDAARSDAVVDHSYLLFPQLPPSMLPPQEPRVPQPYRPPPPHVSSSFLPPVLPSIFPSLNEQMAQVAITPRPDAAGAGLSNATGEYNCFLNSIVQALFHVHCFRAHLLRSMLPSQAPNLAVQRSIALVSALGDLFEALQRGVVLRRSDLDPGAAAPGETQGAVAPTALRQALAALNAGGGEGAMNTMADAAEVLSALYDAFQSVSSAAATRRAVDETPIARMFGFGVREAAVCTAAGCRGKVTHELSFRSFFHIVFSTALRDAHAAAAAQGLRLSFEELLAQLQAGDLKRCDKDVGGCGAAARVRHNLEAPPTVFTISLAWDAAQAAEDVVAATMKALWPELRPELVFDNPPRYEAAGVYELRAMVCYYGSHYAAYVRTDDPNAQSYLPSKPEWSRFDDASVTRVGGWDAVCDACARGHLQPTVLFYEKLPQLF